MPLIFHFIVCLAISAKCMASSVDDLKKRAPVELDMCKGLGYTETSKINLMKQTQSEAAKDYLYRKLLILDKTGCSNLIKGYTCGTYAPKYWDKYGTALPICRSLCQRALKACEKFNFAMAKLTHGGKN